jgi:hypothetical protein
MSILLTALALSTSGTDAPLTIADKKAVPPAVQCRDESGRFRLGCFPKGTVKLMPERNKHKARDTGKKGPRRPR